MVIICGVNSRKRLFGFNSRAVVLSTSVCKRYSCSKNFLSASRGRVSGSESSAQALCENSQSLLSEVTPL